MSKKKIALLLDIKEINALVNLLIEKEQNIHADMHTSDFEIPLKNKLLASLSEDQKKEYIDLETKKVLFRATRIPVDKIKNKDSLTDVLHLNSISIRALAVPFNNISIQFNPDSNITPDDCEACDTVNDCIDLVMANSKPQ